MSIIVKKFGGSSVANTERLFVIARIIKETYEKKHKIVVVISAQGKTTDQLIEKAYKVNSNPSPREMDVLLSSGEQISMALLSMALQKLEVPSVSLTGWQAGIETCSYHSNAKITNINPIRIKENLDKNSVVIVAGFQGINAQGDITTTGRGGSDTTAVALAAVLSADECRIYTDVNGVFVADPNIIPKTEKIDTISYNCMTKFASKGAKVLNKRSVQLAEKYSVPISVLSSFENLHSTTVCEKESKNCGEIKGIAVNKNLILVHISGLFQMCIEKIFDLISNENTVRVCLQKEDSLVIIINGDDKNSSQMIAKKIKSTCEDHKISFFLDENIAEVSVINSNEKNQIVTTNVILKCLKNIKIKSINTEDNLISMLIDKSEIEVVVNKIYSEFFNKS
ncbi:MAG: aspartate kinase [Candidatus Improbicoccus pseudotrichonymphae]|uniref:Aspartokinase n=1 Tax=Candidatus Improbicoccus pseudotrichonymphae TaxID=3033792 RepID=A0AA48IGY3_9FIRM|nr:MAG: aspartate kinase [Candidatus Improbicoccus pseudotrichonymphae]